MEDLPAKFSNLSGTYLQTFKFIKNLVAKFLNLTGTYLQSFYIYEGAIGKVFKFLKDLLTNI